MKKTKETIVINCFGGPGSGKTTAAFYIACELKKRGYVTEYVPEYAKELVWEKRYDLLDGALENQTKLRNEQNHRIKRLVGQVDFVVTDSPVLLNYFYLNKETADHVSYLNDLMKISKQYHNFNMLIRRGNEKFESEGRIHDLKQSKNLDKEIEQLLDAQKIYYGIYKHETLALTVQNAIKTYQRINEQSKKTRR